LIRYKLKIKSALLSWIKIANNFGCLILEPYENRKKKERWKPEMKRGAPIATRSKARIINVSFELRIH